MTVPILFAAPDATLSPKFFFVATNKATQKKYVSSTQHCPPAGGDIRVSTS